MNNQKCPVIKVISGGQSGADRGFLLAARGLGIPTGGIAPKGFRTEYGPCPDLGTVFGLTEDDSKEYPPRTKKNVLSSDGTLIVTGTTGRERGSILTKELCVRLGKPWKFVVINDIRIERPDFWVEQVRKWIVHHNIQTLNGAGNRESVTRGIGGWTRELVRKIFVDWYVRIG